jgi:bifunctional non-homologous end joining protein LigD
VPASKRFEVEVDGRTLSLSNLDKVFYPATGFTKGDVIDYYTRIAPVLLPHLRGRHLTLKRYPNGVEGDFFYEKQCPRHRPDWVRTVGVYSRHNGRAIDYCLVEDLATIVWLANLADLEMHTPLARAAEPKAPTMLAFDLDPGPPATIVDCAEVACRLRDAFDHFGLVAYPKTSGSKGMQLYVPLNTPATYAATKPFARGVAQVLERRHPDLVVSDMRKDLRPGKVLIDWSQNDEHKTTVCVYSLRARARPTVSTPVTWDEVEGVLRSRDPEELAFTSDEVLTRVAEHGDSFAAVLALEQELPA